MFRWIVQIQKDLETYLKSYMHLKSCNYEYMHKQRAKAIVNTARSSHAINQKNAILNPLKLPDPAVASPIYILNLKQTFGYEALNCGTQRLETSPHPRPEIKDQILI